MRGPVRPAEEKTRLNLVFRWVSSVLDEAPNGGSCLLTTLEGGLEGSCQGKSSQGAVWSSPGHPPVWRQKWPEVRLKHICVLLAGDKWPGGMVFTGGHCVPHPHTFGLC